MTRNNIKYLKKDYFKSNYFKLKFGLRPKLIEIIYPDWEEEDKLIFVDAEGSVSITGAVQEGKIDQIIINDEEEIINSDNTFDFVMRVPSNGAKVRIIGYKNDKKVKELIFKVKVGK